MFSYSLGVDLGGTNLRIAAVDEHGNFIEKVTLGTQVSRGREFVINEMTTAIQALSAKLANSGDLMGIGIGVPGLVDIERGMIRESPNLPGWHDYPVQAEIERRLGTTVILENDANAAALGEKWQGAAREFESMCMFTLGTGVGGGIVLNGHVWHGMNSMAGELGHITVEPEGHPCNCGNIGCVEQYASATAIVRMAKEAINRGESAELRRVFEGHDREFSSRVVYQLALQGDRAAQRIYQKVGRSLGTVIAAMINTLNLPIFVIGGGVASAWDAFAPSMFDEVQRRSFLYRATAQDRRSTIITRALLGSDAGLIGAARLVHLRGTNAQLKNRAA